jgi:glyceraldehyde 3-phosphate dehydrogenase
MIRVGINGFGRIGRAICRANLEKQGFELVAVNDINPDINNIAYTVNYDSLYDRLREPFLVDTEASVLYNAAGSIAVFQEHRIADVPWETLDVEVVIDASGVLANVLNSRRLITRGGVRKVIVTHSPDSGVDFNLVLGANEHLLDVERHDVISSSICDATAIAPVLKLMKQHFGLLCGYVTTLHPWLSYQNLMDGPASSWSVPGEIYHHYALGRSVVGNIIPKPTSAIPGDVSRPGGCYRGHDRIVLLSHAYRDRRQCGHHARHGRAGRSGSAPVGARGLRGGTELEHTAQ